MGQVLHGSATTTEAVRRAIKHSQESLRALAKRYGVNQKTIAKWKSSEMSHGVPRRRGAAGMRHTPMRLSLPCDNRMDIERPTPNRRGECGGPEGRSRPPELYRILPRQGLDRYPPQVGELGDAGLPTEASVT